MQKVRMAEDAWNSKNSEKISFAYTVDSVWRNRAEFLTGRKAIVDSLCMSMLPHKLQSALLSLCFTKKYA
jgi:nuclear transport factor 2 (NTF2) superfamily protein